MSGPDGTAFHHSARRGFQHFLGVGQNLQVVCGYLYEFRSTWNEVFVDNDFINMLTRKVNPRHIYEMRNFDVFGRNGLKNGARGNVLGTFIAGLLR